MELEYKWDLTEAGGPAALDAAEVASPFVTGVNDIKMHAIYYDTASGLTQQLRAGLRVRRENDASVCCLKLPVATEGDGAKRREEYEVEADDIHEGLRLLPSVGAPRDICERFLEDGLVVLCETDFTRRAFAIAHDEKATAETGLDGSFTAELAVDVGVFRREGREREFHEMEFEFKSGSETAFHELAKRIQEAGRLQVQPLSKLARAMRV